VSAGLAVTVLGCDGSYPAPGGACSGYLLECGDTRVWMDAGPGTLANLQRHIAIEDIDAVVVSHEHVDHWSDLEHLAVAGKWVIGRSGIPLYCEADLVSAMRVGPASETFDWTRIGPGSKVSVGALDLSFVRTDHSVPTLAVRIDGGGRSLGYSADSGPGWGLAALGPGLDMALCEATYLSDMEGSVPHMSARQAGLTAREAGVGQLVITHLWPRTDRTAAEQEAAAAFGAPVRRAEAGTRYQV
jgi:ribonuclease BN (tRNA processing enzyme)